MKRIEVTSPLDGSNLGHILAADAAQVNTAVTQAQSAFTEWGATPVKERVQPLFRFKHLVEANIRELLRDPLHGEASWC